MDEKDYERFLISTDLLNDRKDRLMEKWKEFKRTNPRAQLWEFPELSSGKSSGKTEKEIVGIVAYCFNPNHYHFILKQEDNNGIEKFMHKLGTSYTNYFNLKNERAGALFQGRYKSTHIESNALLLYLSAYVNCNSEVHEIAKAEDYRWCSFSEYITAGTKSPRRGLSPCEKEIILGQYKSADDYKRVAIETATNIVERRKFEKFLME